MTSNFFLAALQTLAESTRTKEEERMLSPRSYTPPPRTKTLPRSRAARELYFSANSDILIVNRREVSFPRVQRPVSAGATNSRMYSRQEPGA